MIAGLHEESQVPQGMVRPIVVHRRRSLPFGKRVIPCRTQVFATQTVSVVYLTPTVMVVIRGCCSSGSLAESGGTGVPGERLLGSMGWG